MFILEMQNEVDWFGAKTELANIRRISGGHPNTEHKVLVQQRSFAAKMQKIKENSSIRISGRYILRFWPRLSLLMINKEFKKKNSSIRISGGYVPRFWPLVELIDD